MSAQCPKTARSGSCGRLGGTLARGAWSCPDEWRLQGCLDEPSTILRDLPMRDKPFSARRFDQGDLDGSVGGWRFLGVLTPYHAAEQWTFDMPREAPRLVVLDGWFAPPDAGLDTRTPLARLNAIHGAIATTPICHLLLPGAGEGATACAKEPGDERHQQREDDARARNPAISAAGTDCGILISFPSTTRALFPNGCNTAWPVMQASPSNAVCESPLADFFATLYRR